MKYIITLSTLTLLIAACGPDESNPQHVDMGSSILEDMHTDSDQMASDLDTSQDMQTDGGEDTLQDMQMDAADMSANADMQDSDDGGTAKGPVTCDDLGPEAKSVCEFVEAMYDDRLASIYCKAGFQCRGQFSQRDDRFSRYADEADCREHFVRVENRFRDPKPDTFFVVSNVVLDREQIYQSAEQGRIMLDEAKAQSCLDDLDAILARDACDIDFVRSDVIERIWECRTAMAGKVMDGGDCLTQQDCEGYKIDEIGSPFCRKPTDAMTCDLGVCESFGDIPELCGLCEASEYCDQQTGSCVEEIELGEPCMSFAQCGSNERYCDFTAAEEGGLCAELGAKAAGEPCTQDRQCISGLLCDTRGVAMYGSCARPEDVIFGTQGETCDPKGDGCEAGLVCTNAGGATSTCELPGGPGAPCSTREDCAAELTCPGGDNVNDTQGTCEIAREDGERCTSQLDCLSNRCFSGRCAPALTCLQVSN